LRVSVRPLVLVVEDDPDNLESLVELLADEGYDTLTARTGEQARARASGAKLCMMIVDYLLPDTTGTDLVRKLRRESDARVPVVFLTGATDLIDTPDHSLVVHKPIAVDQLLQALNEHCSSPP
jgi:DNA-binding response OmpR family regulator